MRLNGWQIAENQLVCKEITRCLDVSKEDAEKTQ